MLVGPSVAHLTPHDKVIIDFQDYQNCLNTESKASWGGAGNDFLVGFSGGKLFMNELVEAIRST